jgi:cytochrome c-type biogenesis protein CcmH/NrfG
LAISLFYQGKFSLAESLLKDILILDPENPTAKSFLEKIKKEKKGEN